AICNEGYGNGDDGEVVDLAVLELRPRHARPSSGRGYGNLHHQLVGLQNILPEDVLARPNEVRIERHVARARGAGNLCHSIQRQQRGGRIRRMNDVAQLATYDGVVRVLTGDREAEVAALLVASEVLASEEPAPRPLIDVSAQRAEVADQRRRYRRR